MILRSLLVGTFLAGAGAANACEFSGFWYPATSQGGQAGGIIGKSLTSIDGSSVRYRFDAQADGSWESDLTMPLDGDCSSFAMRGRTAVGRFQVDAEGVMRGRRDVIAGENKGAIFIYAEEGAQVKSVALRGENLTFGD